MAVSSVIIGGKSVGIVDLEEAFRKVGEAGVSDPEAVKGLILEKVREGNYIPAKLEPVYREDLYEEYLVHTGVLPERRKRPAVEIRLYGASCSRCDLLDDMVKNVLSRNGLKVDYQYIDDMREMARAGILEAPALVVSGRTLLMGHVPGERDLEGMLLKAIDAASEGGG
ncbi:MAG TPA: thioredoxin family protein [Deltaproteobacteria bacterium]|jgi:hypothetical protein|nr:thioredoxin family protein [Deltaproteobacteria bacterium]HOI06027.1 thioredoxin family protein [Deltaproteobacteria bacterium]